jgi:hypothetical protein
MLSSVSTQYTFYPCHYLTYPTQPAYRTYSVILATPDATPTRKRFLSRTARYSGLLNILDFESADLDNTANLTALLTGRQYNVLDHI